MKISRKDFFNEAYTSARAAGLNDTQARLAASQAALETGYGKSVVGNNYFGIKAGKSWGGPAVTAGTWEDTSKGAVRQKSRFRAYDNPAKSFADWASTVSRRWGDAFNAPTLEKAISGLRYGKPGGYATDRNYGSKLRSINAKYGPQADQVDGIMSAVNPAHTVVPTAKPVQASILADPMQQLQRNREIGLLGMEATNSQPMRGLRADLNAQRMSMEPADLQPISDPMDGLRSGLLAQREQFEARPTEISRNPFDTMQSEPQAMAKTGRLSPSLTSFEEEAREQTARNRLAAGLREQRGLLQANAPVSGLLSEAATPTTFDQRFAGPVQTQPQASAGLGTNGLPESAPMGTVVQGQDGQNYQYVEATGMQGATSPGTWSRVNGIGPTNTAINVVSPDERTMVDRQRAFLSSQPLNSNTGARLLSGAKGLAGGFGGALLGGALLGPVGGLLGGLVGRQMTTGGLLNRYPDAPKGKTQGDGKETDYGRSVRESSKQYDRAARSGSVGLY